MLTVIGRRDEEVEISVVLIARGFWKVSYVDVRVCTAFDIVICRLQEGGEAMLPLRFSTPGKTTIQAVAMLAMIAHQSSDMHHSRAVRGEQC
jgi:hypothetical protein